MSKQEINKYKLKEVYFSKLDKYIEGLDNKTKKDISNGNNVNR